MRYSVMPYYGGLIDTYACRSVLGDYAFSPGQWNGYRQSYCAGPVRGVGLRNANILAVCVVSGDILVWSS